MHNTAKEQMKEEYLTTHEIASHLKVNVMTVRRWIKAGKLPAVFLGQGYRIKRNDLENFLEKRRKLKKQL